jgi:hypothetical protein
MDQGSGYRVQGSRFSNLGIIFFSNWIEYFLVIPAEAGIQAIHNLLKTLDSLFQGNDEKGHSQLFTNPPNVTIFQI